MPPLRGPITARNFLLTSKKLGRILRRVATIFAGPDFQLFIL